MIILYILLSGILGGLLNRARGGWAYDSGYKISHGILRLILALFMTCCLYFPYWLNNHFNSNDYIWFAGVWLSSFLSLLSGWGSWFSIGRELTSYRHNRDWILSEWLSYLRYGPKWIPSQNNKVRFEEDQHLVKRFNYELSPEGFIRPNKWRRDMELFAMNIRGLTFTTLPTLVFSIHLNLNLYYLFFIIPTGYIFGHLYEIGYKFDFDKFPDWIKGNTHIGEILSGSTIMSSFLLVFSYFAIKLS